MLDFITRCTHYSLVAVFVFSILGFVTCAGGQTQKEKPRITGVTANSDTPSDSTRLTLTTDGITPSIHRNVGCGGGPIAVNTNTEATIKVDNKPYKMEVVSANFIDDEIEVALPESVREKVEAGKDYEIALFLPDGDIIGDEFSIWTPKKEDDEDDTEPVDEPDCAEEDDNCDDTGEPEDTDIPEDSDTPEPEDTDIPEDTNIPEDTDTPEETDTPEDTDTPVETDTPEDTETTEDTATMLVDTDTPEDTDTGFANPLHIEAECAFGADMGECDNFTEGWISEGVYDPETNELAPTCEEDCTVVGYMDPYAFVAFPDVDFTNYDSVTLRIANLKTNASIVVLVDGTGSENEIARFTPPVTDWDEYVTISSEIRFALSQEQVTGVHDLYVMGGTNNYRQGNGNIDWIQLSSSETPYNAAPDLCDSSVDDCYEDCWECAASGYCASEETQCDNNADCSAIYSCVESYCFNSFYATSESSCIANCIESYPDGANDFGALQHCIMCDVCTTGCSGEFTCLP